MYEFIAHPETGTPVHIRSHLGLGIISAYANKLEMVGGNDSAFENNSDYSSSSLTSHSTDSDTSSSSSNETTSEMVSRLKSELGHKGVVLNSRDVSRYSEGQYVENIGKNKNVTGHVHSVIADSGSDNESVDSGKVGKLLIKLAI